jgi:hypothetical protein
LASSPLNHFPWVADGLLIEYISVEMDTLIWKPLRQRSDKLIPNVEWVAQSIAQTILEHITDTDVLQVRGGPKSHLPPATKRKLLPR